MTAYRFRAVSAVALFLLLAFAVLAFGLVEGWALLIFELGVFALAAVWALGLAWGKASWVWNPIYLPLGLVVGWMGVQYARGISVYPYRTASEGLKWLSLGLLFVLAAHVFADPTLRRAFGRALVWFLFVVCVFGLIQNFTSTGLLYWTIPVPLGRIFGPFVNANHFTALLELVIPTAALLVVRAGEQRLIYTGVLTILLAAVVVCASRMGIVLVAVETALVLGFLALKRRHPKETRARRVGIAATAVVLMAAVVGLVLTNRGVAARFEEEQPYQVRWTVAQATWKLFLARPWTGYGAGTFDQVYPSANPIDTGVFWSHAHNDPLQFAMEWGVIGPAALLWILWLLWRGRWTQDQWLRAVLPVTVVLIHSWVDFPLQIPAVAAAWLLVLAMLPAAGKPERASAAPPLSASQP